MRRLLVLIFTMAIVPLTMGGIILEVFEADGETVFNNRDIMTGTKLVLLLSSDSNDYWSGGLFVDGNDRAFGALSGSGYDPNTRDYNDCHLASAGMFARATSWKGSLRYGFDLYTFYPVDGNSDSNTTVTGEWFMINYKATAAGDCNVGFYDYDISWSEPNYNAGFMHARSCDFDSDANVNFVDYSIFASQWQRTDCSDPNWCAGTDLDIDGDVDSMDLGLFAEFWLWPHVPANPPIPVDANRTFSVVDINGSNDITIDINETVTLYLVLDTTVDTNVGLFDIEVQISNTGLGSIDNTAIDPNDPNVGTAQILATPRDTSFDYYGPGGIQPENILLSAANLFGNMNDGNLASFEFTCTGEGDVILTPVDYMTYNPKLEAITIHQNDPCSQQMMGGGEEMLMGTTSFIQEPQPLSTDEINEIILWLEKSWLEDESIREAINEDEWNNFIEAIKNPEQPLY